MIRLLLNFVSSYLLLISLFLLGVDLFINLPMNGVYSLPGKWSKDNTITIGIIVSIIISIIIFYFIPNTVINYTIFLTAPYVYLYLYGNTKVHLTSLIKSV